MRSSFHPGVGVLSLLALVTVAAPAAANSADDAKALFESGVADMEAGRYEQGCKEIADSQSLDPHPGTLYALATCQSRWGHVKAAAARFGEYLEVYARLTPAQQKRQGDRAEVARKERESLTAATPELMISLPPGAPAGAVVKLNGEILGAAALGVGQPLEPGDYLLSTQAPGGPVWEQRITLQRGQRLQVVAEVKPAPVVEPPPSKQEPPPFPPALPPPSPVQVKPPVGEGASARQKVAYLSGGIGIAGLVLGGVLGGLALGKKSVIQQHCGSGIRSKDETECDQVGLDAASSAKTLGFVSTIELVTGIVGVGTGAVLLLTAPRSNTPKAGASGRWISAGVLSAGPAGATMGARGAW